MFFKKEQDSQTRKRVVLSKETVKQELDLFLEKLPGLKDVNIKIGTDEADTFGARISPEGYSIAGGYVPATNTLYIVSNAAKSIHHLRQTIHHELLVHKGLGVYSEKEQQTLLRAIYESATSGEASLAAHWKKTLEDYKGEPDIVQAEELLALLSEEDLTFWQSPKLSKILYAFRRILKRLGIISNKLTKDDLIEEIHN